MDQPLRSGPIHPYVFLGTLISFRNRQPRVVGPPSIGGTLRKWNVGTNKRDGVRGHPSARVPQVPTCIGSERYFELRQPYASSVITITVHLRHQYAVGLAYRRRLACDDPVLPL